MGIPSNYSRELPERCLHLIEALWSSAQSTFMPGHEGIGPLTTTFLLAMANPMIVLPIERVERHLGKTIDGYMDERSLDPELAVAVEAGLGGNPLRKSPFFEAGKWRFARIPHQPGQNLAIYFPQHLSEMLSAQQALTDAARMPASQWASCLRNALAHGGIAYLDADGFQTYGQRAEKLAFISGKYVGEPTTLVQLNVICIDECDFVSFLRKWVIWLQETGLSVKLAA